MTLDWRDVLDWAAQATAAGLPIKAQVLGRAIGVMLGHELTLNTFYTCASYVKLASLPFAEKIRELERPETRARILAESADPDPAIVLGRLAREFDHMFLLGDPPDYEQPFDQSIAARAQRENVSPEALVYDLMLEREGRNNLYVTLCNYEHGSLDSSLEMMRHAGAVLGLGDGGAHCGTICDGSYPTFMLTHWVRDRTARRAAPLATVVKWLCRDTAQAVGLADRGILAPGFKADVNVIDVDRLRLHAPEVARDLPSGGRRLVPAGRRVRGDDPQRHRRSTRRRSDRRVAGSVGARSATGAIMIAAGRCGQSMDTVDNDRRRTCAAIVAACSLVGLAATVLVVLPAEAQEKFPSRPIELIVPTPPGGGVDITGRMLAEAAESVFGVPWSSSTSPAQPGGSAWTMVAAKPDGYTVAYVWNAPVTIVPQLLPVSYNLQSFHAGQPDHGRYAAHLLREPRFPRATARNSSRFCSAIPASIRTATTARAEWSSSRASDCSAPQRQAAAGTVQGRRGDAAGFSRGHVDVYGGSVPAVGQHMKDGAARCLLVTTRERNPAAPVRSAQRSRPARPRDGALAAASSRRRTFPADRLKILEDGFRKPRVARA
jgi:hypothetical protein